VARDGEVAATVAFGEDATHLAGISPAAAGALEMAGMTLNDVTRLALTIGPGSFTGLRIGLAFAKGLVASRGIELATISTLELLACGHNDCPRPWPQVLMFLELHSLVH
jgi:tRNA threonylcarbamoyladenosine biosynthesis protein TsaB